MSCFDNEKVLGELVKLIIFGIPCAVCVEPVESYAKLITLLVGMTLGNSQLHTDNQSAPAAVQNKQKAKKGSKSKQNKAGNLQKEQNGIPKRYSSEQNCGSGASGEQVQNHGPNARGGGDTTLLAHYVARAAYLTWSSDYLQSEMQSSRLPALLSSRHPILEDATANKSPQCTYLTETVAERIARETVMREVVKRKDKEMIQEAFHEISSSHDVVSAAGEDPGGDTSASLTQLRFQLEKFLNYDDISPTEPNAFRDLMNVFLGGADSPSSFGRMFSFLYSPIANTKIFCVHRNSPGEVNLHGMLPSFVIRVARG